MNDLSIASRIERVRERMSIAALQSGRSPDTVTLIAVTKTVSTERILEAIQAGVRHCGENYVQEARTKIPLINERCQKDDIHINWHLIGHLQSNKVKSAIELFSLVQSVDNYQLVQEFARRMKNREGKQSVLIEVDLTESETRSGVRCADFQALVDAVLTQPQLNLRGLMGIAPIVETSDAARAYFARLRSLFETLPPENREILSMGMSADFEPAILEGATHVRIGSAIFGPRSLKQ